MVKVVINGPYELCYYVATLVKGWEAIWQCDLNSGWLSSTLCWFDPIAACRVGPIITPERQVVFDPATDANQALEALSLEWWQASNTFRGDECKVKINTGDSTCFAKHKSFSVAACICLLKSEGYDVEYNEEVTHGQGR